MRTNVNLDDDTYAHIAAYASARKLSLGKAIGELVCKANAASPPPSRLVLGPLGILQMPSRGSGHEITQESVDKARADGYFG